MTRVGVNVLEHLNDNDFVKGLHSVGKPLEANQPDVPWPTNERKWIWFVVLFCVYCFLCL